MRIFFICTVLFLSFSIVCCKVGRYVSGGHSVAVGESMSPTIKNGDHFGHALIKVGDLQPIERFDIIVFKVYANSADKIKEDTQFVFRVIGLEGEKVELRKGRIFINDELIEESFEKIESKDSFAPIIIPSGEYFVLGDNRPNSFDSRFWKYKTVKRADIVGVVSNIIRKEDYDKGKRW